MEKHEGTNVEGEIPVPKRPPVELTDGIVDDPQDDELLATKPPADPYRAARQFERSILMGEQTHRPVDATKGTLIGTIVYDEETLSVTFLRPGQDAVSYKRPAERGVASPSLDDVARQQIEFAVSKGPRSPSEAVKLGQLALFNDDPES